MEKVRIGLIGVGHLGKMHAKLLKQIPNCDLVGVTDLDFERAQTVAAEFQTTAFRSPADFFGQVDAVDIVTPTVVHFECAKPFIEKGIPAFIEKPYMRTLEEADQITALANRTGAIIQVGHIERYNPAVRAVRELITKPRFIESDRISPYSFRSTDISVILDLMVHDLDLILQFVQAPVKSVSAFGVGVLSNEEDVATAQVLFEDGCVANLTASRLSLKAERRLRVFQQDSYISIDFQERVAKYYAKGPLLQSGKFDLSKIDLSKIADKKDFVFNDLIQTREFRIAEANPLKEELEDFIVCARDRKTPVVTAEHGRRVLAVATMIESAIRRQKL